MNLRRLFRRDPLRAKAWRRRDHPLLDAAGRAELQRMITEQADRVSAAIAPPPRSSGLGIGAALELAAARRHSHLPGGA